MAGSFKNFRTTSNSHLFQQVLRGNTALARQATRDRDPMALSADRAVQKGASSVLLLDAVLRGYNPDRLFVDPINPFLIQPSACIPATGSHFGGTTVSIIVDDSSSAIGAQVGGADLADFEIVDETQVRGRIAHSHAFGIVDVAVLNAFGKGILIGGFTFI